MPETEIVNPESLASLFKNLKEEFKKPLKLMKRLENMNVIEKKLVVPKIIVIGDEQSGKTRLVTSLTGIPFPSDLKIPLVLNFKNLPGELDVTQVHVKVAGRYVEVKDRVALTEAIQQAAELILNNKTMDLYVDVVAEEHGVPDLQIIDLPGITPRLMEDRRIKSLIFGQMKHEEFMILHVTSSDNLLPVNSTEMLKKLDATGAKTLCVATKGDIYSESFAEKLTTSNVVTNKLGVYCVRNIMVGENFEQSQEREKELFEKPIFSDVDRSYLGMNSLAKQLALCLLSIMFHPSSLIVEKVNADLQISETEKKAIEHRFTTIVEAKPYFVSIVKSAESTLKELFITQHFDNYKNEPSFHGSVKMVEGLEFLHASLKAHHQKGDCVIEYLTQEIDLINKRKVASTPNIIPNTLFDSLLGEIISSVSSVVDFAIFDLWSDIKHTVLRVLRDRSKCHPQLSSAVEKIGQIVVEEFKADFAKKVYEIMELEKQFHYTCNSEIVSNKVEMMKLSNCKISIVVKDGRVCRFLDVPNLRLVDIAHLEHVPETTWHMAFEMKITMLAYWDVAVNRIVDYFTLNLLNSVKKMIAGLEPLMLKEFQDEELLKEEHVVTVNRGNLEKRSEILKQVQKEIKGMQNEFKVFMK